MSKKETLPKEISWADWSEPLTSEIRNNHQDVSEHDLITTDIIDAFQSPEKIRKAIILSEIIRRPEERWNFE